MRRYWIESCLAVAVALCCCACSGHEEQPMAWEPSLELSGDSVAYQQVLGEPDQGVITVAEDVDLNGKVCCLPEGITLSFKGGVISNGTLVGDGTRIVSEGVCFDRVRIQGTWDVPEISTAMFRDLAYDNSLKDVVALAHPDVKNRIVIERGEYQVSACQDDRVCVRIRSNTELFMEGTVRIVPNDYTHYFMFQVEGENIEIRGSGTIIGDKHTHTGKEGEWGMGIRLAPVHRVTVSGLTVKDCWGDCIYVGGNSRDVLIENCRLDHGRRQGISITAADRVTIKDCTITNVAGTNPEYAIDVEPNGGDVVDHVTIDHVTVRDCKGGFLVYGWAADARVGTVTIRNCDVAAVKKGVVEAGACDSLLVENSQLVQYNSRGTVSCKRVSYVNASNNTLCYDAGIILTLKETAWRMLGRGKIDVINMMNCENVETKGNNVCEF